MFNEIWPLISVVLGIVILLVLIIGFKLNTFISLIITSMITALMLGIPLTKIMETIEKGMGSTLGHIALIFGLGAILGNYLLMVVVQLNCRHVDSKIWSKTCTMGNACCSIYRRYCIVL